MASFMLSHFSYVLFPQLMSQGGVDVLVLLVEVTQAWDIATAMDVARAAVMLTAETSSREAIAARDSATLHVKDAGDQAALVEREALQRVWRVEAENPMMLTSGHDDAKGLAQKITLLEDELAAERRSWEVSERERREKFKELTLLQSRDSVMCHTIVSPQ
jgi:hypothetical protein